MSNPCGTVIESPAVPHQFGIDIRCEVYHMNQYKTNQERAHEMADYIFRTLFPLAGQLVREDQITLCHTMLDALFHRRIALCDAGVGIGKTYAYLVACILWRESRSAQLKQALAISTSSVALQESIIQEYLPFLSDLLYKNNIIAKPICAVVRKGKERFVCDRRLVERQRQLRNGSPRNSHKLQVLHQLTQTSDLDSIADLSHFDRQLVCVPPTCPAGCVYQNKCRYHLYLQEALSPQVDIQICNHNYLLADANHRQQELRPLLKDYSALVVDEAHKFPEAAQQTNLLQLREEDCTGLSALLQREHFTFLAQRLYSVLQLLLTALTIHGRREIEIDYVPTKESVAALSAAIQILEKIVKTLRWQIPLHIIYRLEETECFLQLFLSESNRHILYIRYDREGHPALCAVSREIPLLMEHTLWTSGKPILLASGTLAVGTDFSRSRQLLGIGEHLPVSQITLPSPFDYQRNCLLYIPGNDVPGPNSQDEVQYLCNEISHLIQTTHGHGLVLFTSYHLMNSVYRQMPVDPHIPILLAWRGKMKVIQEFKERSNAVLFAAGSCWEGMDFPGDMVSLLVIPRLPFPTPDPVSRAEQTKYPSLQEYLNAVIVPDMQRKLRQGFGRAIRLETDTCVVALLDHRAQHGQRYHRAALESLPDCPITDKISEIENFIRAKKGPDYFFVEESNEL